MKIPWTARRRSGLSGLGALGKKAAPIVAPTIPIGQMTTDQLNGAITDTQAAITKINDYIQKLNVEYAANHAGGMSPDQFQGVIAGQNSKIYKLQAQLDAYNAQLQKIATAQTAAQAAAAATPAAQAQATQDSANQYRTLSFLLGQAGYDYGSGSTQRNAYYKGLSGLGGSRAIIAPKRAAPRTEDGSMRGLYRLSKRPALSASVLDVLSQGATADFNNIISAGASSIKSNISSLSVGGPTFLQNIFGNVKKSVIGGAAPSSSAVTASQASGYKAAAVSSGPNPLILAAGVAAVVWLLA